MLYYYLPDSDMDLTVKHLIFYCLLHSRYLILGNEYYLLPHIYKRKPTDRLMK